jgi:hypothetical protein
VSGGLAYVFWHWKGEAIDASAYEQRARDFHASLAARPPEGFVRSACFAIAGAAWIPGGGAAYEDWYRIDSSAALDSLERAAVAPPHQTPHDAIAGQVAGGTAGLYRLRRGSPLDGEARHAHWFRKPPGMTYESLYRLLDPLVEVNGAAIWGRQMVLGPAPEFCLHAREAAVLSAPLEGAAIPLSRVWP